MIETAGGSGGLIAVNALGEYSMEFNSKGMFRGVCDSHGECSVGIWEEMIPIQVKVAPELDPALQTIPEVAVTARVDSESLIGDRVTERP
jgi:Asparaginase